MLCINNIEGFKLSVFSLPAFRLNRPFMSLSFLSSSLQQPKSLRIGLFWRNTAELRLVGPLGFEPRIACAPGMYPILVVRTLYHVQTRRRPRASRLCSSSRKVFSEYLGARNSAKNVHGFFHLRKQYT